MVADQRSVHIGSGNMFSMLLHVLGHSLKVYLGPSVCQAAYFFYFPKVFAGKSTVPAIGH